MKEGALRKLQTGKEKHQTKNQILRGADNVKNPTEKIKQPKPSKPPQQILSPQPHYFKKRIGSTYYKVAVYHSDTSKENIEDKILRLAKNDAANITNSMNTKGAVNQ